MFWPRHCTEGLGESEMLTNVSRHADLAVSAVPLFGLSAIALFIGILYAKACPPPFLSRKLRPLQMAQLQEARCATTIKRSHRILRLRTTVGGEMPGYRFCCSNFTAIFSPLLPVGEPIFLLHRRRAGHNGGWLFALYRRRVSARKQTH
jgi:hypothetical protein